MGGMDGAVAVTLLLVGVHRISIAFRAWQKKMSVCRLEAINRHFSQEYMPWWRQTDGAATKFKTEVNLNIGLKPDFSIQIKHWFKT